jgi:hypothetical protein
LLIFMGLNHIANYSTILNYFQHIYLI